MGGGRKLKKKPVLVLDPEELAAAHAAFHEASAEQLGETVERAPKPAMILGLAPMEEDDAAEMGQADDVGEYADTGQPTPEEVLALTRRKSDPVVDDMPFEESEPGEFEQLDRLDTIDDGLDIANRIFPSLSLVDLEKRDGEQDSRPFVFPAAFREAVGPSTPPPAEATPTAPAEPEPKTDRLEQSPAQGKEQPRLSALDAVAKRIEARPAPEEPVKAEPEQPSPASIEAAFPVKDGSAAPPSEPEAPIENSAPPPARFDELPPGKDYDTPDDVYDLDVWLADEEQGDQAPLADYAAPKPAAVPEPTQSDLPTVDQTGGFSDEPVEAVAPEPIGAGEPDSEHITYTEDDTTDGYAFMRDKHSRREGVAGAQRGRQSALRAKLLRETEEDAQREASSDVSNSLFIGVWNWLRGLFRR